MAPRSRREVRTIDDFVNDTNVGTLAMESDSQPLLEHIPFSYDDAWLGSRSSFEI